MPKVFYACVILFFLSDAELKATEEPTQSQGTFGPHRPALPAITPDILATINRIRAHHISRYETTISEEAALILHEVPFFMLPAPVLNDVDFKQADDPLTQARKFVRLALRVKDDLHPFSESEHALKADVMARCFLRAADAAQHIGCDDRHHPDYYISIAQLYFWGSRFQRHAGDAFISQQRAMVFLRFGEELLLEQGPTLWNIYSPVIHRLRFQIGSTVSRL